MPMLLARSSVRLFAGHLLVSLGVLYINWQFIEGAQQSLYMVVLIAVVLATMLRGQVFLKKGNITFAWGMVLIPPLILLVGYFSLRIMGLR